MKKLIPLLLLCGCATLKPVPQQTLDCLKAEANAGNALKAAQCIATGGTTSQIENCYLGIAEGAGLDMLQCEALAIWGDFQHAQSMAVATSVPNQTLQLNAVMYLKGK